MEIVGRSQGRRNYHIAHAHGIHAHGMHTQLPIVPMIMESSAPSTSLFEVHCWFGWYSTHASSATPSMHISHPISSLLQPHMHIHGCTWMQTYMGTRMHMCAWMRTLRTVKSGGVNSGTPSERCKCRLFRLCKNSRKVRPSRPISLA
jgi:hypothetical protein